MRERMIASVVKWSSWLGRLVAVEKVGLSAKMLGNDCEDSWPKGLLEVEWTGTLI
jgi:hypothetical protein